MARQFTSEERKFLRDEMHPEHSLYSAWLINPTANELFIQVLGLPLKAGPNPGELEPCLAGEEALATEFGVEFEKYCVEANGGRSQRKITTIKHGPVVVSVEGLAKTDPEGNDYDATALEAALAALPISAVRIDDNRANLMAETGF